MTKTEKAYIAGYFDGEACVRMQKIKKGNTYTAMIEIASTADAPLLCIKELLGGNITKQPPSLHTKNLANRLRISGVEAVKALKEIRSYLKVKGIQADTIIEAYSSGNKEIAFHAIKNMNSGARKYIESGVIAREGNRVLDKYKDARKAAAR